MKDKILTPDLSMKKNIVNLFSKIIQKRQRYREKNQEGQKLNFLINSQWKL